MLTTIDCGDVCPETPSGQHNPFLIEVSRVYSEFEDHHVQDTSQHNFGSRQYFIQQIRNLNLFWEEP